MITKDDYVITAFAYSASGPGWANSLVIAIVKDQNGKIREEYIQPEDQTDRMHILFSVSQAAHNSMVVAVNNRFKK